MKIGIIGAGNIGAAAAKLFIKAGHEIAIANSRSAETLQELVKNLGAKATAVSIEEAANFGEIVLIAIPFGKYETLPSNTFHGEIVIDAGNYYPNRDGNFAEIDSGATTSSELVAAHLHGARYVKGFNTIYFVHLAEQGDVNLPLEKRRAIFIAGDDSVAKETVAKLIEEIGFAAVDTGFLKEGGKLQQPGTKIYNLDLSQKTALEILGEE
jgi:8-hydroxy-5-deazaflavin:NADPH oxidoreductase